MVDSKGKLESNLQEDKYNIQRDPCSRLFVPERQFVLNIPYQGQRESLSKVSNHKIRNRLCLITMGASGGGQRVHCGRGEKKLRTAQHCITSNGNTSKTKANESFNNSVFFDIEAKRTPSLESKLFSKRSKHIR
jgi:hypothetical protein